MVIRKDVKMLNLVMENFKIQFVCYCTERL